MWLALMMTTLAGLSTGLGGLLAILARKPGPGMMAFSMGFAGGVMLTVSLTDMLPHTVQQYMELAGRGAAAAAGMSASLCLCGMAAAAMLEKLVPEPASDAGGARPAGRAAALRSAVITALAILLHTLPEGILTMFTGYSDPRLGAPLALAIALHNIPEGIAVAVPLYYATQSRWRAFLASLGSGLAEPAGALIAFFCLRSLIGPLFLNGMIALIAGVMVYVSASQLLPEGFAQGLRGNTAAGLCAGVLVMSTAVHLV